MERLLAFLGRYYNLMLFLALELFAYSLLANHNENQRQAFSGWFLNVTGWMQESNANLVAYFNLDEENRELQAENIRLRREMNQLQVSLKKIKSRAPDTFGFLALSADTTDSLDAKAADFAAIPARVISNSAYSNYNYLAVDAGSAEGVKPGMGVVSAQGVAGMVVSAGEEYAMAMSLLNLNFNVSAKVKGKNVMGSFGWKGKRADQGALMYVPDHYHLVPGDTVVTSGYSSIFPENFLLGRISSVKPSQEHEGFHEIIVNLSVDFHTLDFVYLVENPYKTALDTLKPETAP